MAFPLTKGLGSCGPTSLTALQRKREEEIQAKPSAQASAAVSEQPCICLKDIEVSRGCDLLHGLSSCDWQLCAGQRRVQLPPCS